MGATLKHPEYVTRKEAAKHYFYAIYKGRARHKGIVFNITYDEFEQIICQNCYYCGTKGRYVIKNGSRNGNQALNVVLIACGVDRIDSNFGYTLDNVVPCCSYCNYAKRDMSTKDFIALAQRIAEKHSYNWRENI